MICGCSCHKYENNNSICCSCICDIDKLPTKGNTVTLESMRLKNA
jgi:hypothetical protein